MTSVRIDKWLWAARFFKTRALAAKACELGRIQFNGQNAKPAREIRIGGMLRITNPGGTFEVEVLLLIASGMSSKQAAYELGMSARTATCHRYHIFQKLHVTKAAELVIRAAEMGLIDLHANGRLKANPALTERILAVQQENTAELQKLAALVAESKILRQTVANSRQELHAARRDVMISVKELRHATVGD